jgi:hypothetical protein
MTHPLGGGCVSRSVVLCSHAPLRRRAPDRSIVHFPLAPELRLILSEHEAFHNYARMRAPRLSGPMHALFAEHRRNGGGAPGQGQGKKEG